MLTITLRDLQWRARRFGLGVAATALVFATTLLLVGVYSSFQNEARRTVEIFNADRWAVPAGVSGPFTASSPAGDELRDAVAAAPGVRVAEPVALFRHMVDHAGREVPVNVIAVLPGGMVRPQIVAGRPIALSGDAVADERAGIPVGATVTMADLPLRVVGHTRDLTYFAGTPAILIPLVDGRRVAYDAAPLSTAVVMSGTPSAPVSGAELMTSEAAIEDLRTPVKGAITTIAVLALILSIVAAGIIGLMTYMSGLDRMLDFAVFKAIGVRTNKLLAGLVIQVLALALGAALAAALLAKLLAPVFPVGVDLGAPAYLGLLGLALGVGLLVSLLSVRQAVQVDPALAFGRN